MDRVFSSLVQALERPDLICLQKGLYAASFSLMKLMPARFIVDRMTAEGVIDNGGLVVETTSGTFGLALALMCRLRGYRFTMVSDPIVDRRLKRRLEELGATVEIVEKPAPVGGYQGSRMERLRRLIDANPGCAWPCQYDNPQNPAAYARLAEILTGALGQIDCLVGTVGSGGSMCGTSMSLRTLFPHLRVIGVDTNNSVLFGQKDGPRLVRGLGNSLLPRNLDHTAFDEVHWVGPTAAFAWTRILHRKSGLYMGGTSGAAYLVARWYAEEHPDQTTVVLLPDEGHRYEDTIYNDDWLSERNILLSDAPSNPAEVSHPLEACQEWMRIAWKRRTRDEVLKPSSGADERR